MISIVLFRMACQNTFLTLFSHQMEYGLKPLVSTHVHNKTNTSKRVNNLHRVSKTKHERQKQILRDSLKPNVKL